MTVFNKYSRYYDLLYSDKSYEIEVDFIDDLLKKYCESVTTILELGCGTGGHASYFSRRGYKVTGVDLSEEMLQIAHEKYQDTDNASGGIINFRHGDIRNVSLDITFDAIISLFHVVSYQTGNDDLMATFHNVKRHLTPDGVFVFDCWYGPGVLTDLPVTRVKQFSGYGLSITRIAEPIIHPNENVVDVNYRILLIDDKTGHLEELTELHRMRYLFVPEIEMMLQQCGMKLIKHGAWLSEHQPELHSWNAYFVCTHA